jgi:hypothetical protein
VARRQGQALEQLVAELERVLGPTDVIITSPDYILGYQTGSRREVDVSLRARVGSAQILVIIECRDRQKVQDARWIEQIAGKKDDVRADRAVAVSPSGFTKGARNLAQTRKIDLRTIMSVTGPEVFGWLGLRTLEVRKWWTEYRVIRPGIEDGRLEFAPELIEAVNSSTPHLAPILIRRSDGAAVSVDDVWKMVPKDQIFTQLEPGKEYSFDFNLDFHRDSTPFQLRAVDGLVDLVGLELGGLIKYTELEVPISRFYEYVGESGALIQTAEVDLDYEGARIVLGMNATPDKMKHFVTVRKADDNGPEVIHLQMGAVYREADEDDGTDTEGSVSNSGTYQ